MKKRVLALGTVWLVAVFVSLGPASAPATGSSAKSAGSTLSRAVVGGLVVALSPVGALVGCGGGGSPTSATAVPLQ